ncbi:hypothetical protein CspeluHIS016_0600720 [Cutaneotrichosporon spelunceum]|uniref:Alpha/beta-hydrolase n=1 Tax=Cutaneotrichosporon spelunceum TaxID=1672016 RepID=A0AAD3TY62_9TREE|nr:hypothetical protein CspeluHIS016_0600720 [Cutaneotrichosporon spelunceum]
MTRRPLPPCRPGFTDHVYATVHGVDLPLRVWPAKGARGGAKVPWVLWIHGGGYTAGKWTAPTAWVTRAFGDRGYAIASVGYRQQPQAALPDMLADCLAAALWCRLNLPALVGADPDAWLVAGSSGGGTLACLVAHAPLFSVPSTPGVLPGISDSSDLSAFGSRSDPYHSSPNPNLNPSPSPSLSPSDPSTLPAPRVLVNVYGVSNNADDHHHNTYRTAPVEDYYVADEAELAEALADRDPRNAITQSPWAYELPPAVSLSECRAALGLPNFVPERKHFARNDLWSYVARYRLLYTTMFRRETFPDVHGAAGREYWRHVMRYSALHLLDRAEGYPPTFLWHGTGDRDVRVQQSWEFGDRLRARGVPVGEVYPEGLGHTFDFEIQTPEDKGWEWVEEMLDFVDAHIDGDMESD